MLKLFLTFFKIGLFTFGGGYSMIPLISEELVEFNIDSMTFTDFIAISESTPGPFAVNIATFIGYSTHGILGAIIATLGAILPSFIIMLILSIFINKIKNTKFFKTFLKITTPIIIGLILSSTLKIFNQNIFSIDSLKEAYNFNLNLITLISLVILSAISILYFKIKKKRLAPLKIISISFILGLSSYFINLI